MPDDNSPNNSTDRNVVKESALPLGAGEVAALIRQEVDRNNKYLEFAQNQISQDRSFYKHLYTFAGAFIALMIAVAGFFQYASVSQMRADTKATVDAELDRDKAEIGALHAEATAANAEAQATITKELANVRIEVQKRIDTEFRSENITALVSAAAKARTERELTGIIHSEAAAQVAKGIQDEQPFIRSTVENQTKDAVKGLEPTISSRVDKATQEQVAKSVAPIASQMEKYGDMIRMGNMTTLARADDRPSFDYLLQVALGNAPDSANPELRKLADSTAGAIIAEKRSGIQLSLQFKEPQTPEAMKNFLLSPNPTERQAALDNYPQNDNSILPMLLEIIRSDASITVVFKATGRFNALTKQSFEFWKTQEILDWWAKNQNSFK